MTTDAVVAPEKLPFLSRIWHGILLGFLIGATNLVFTSPSFKGNIGEFEFAFSYFSYTTVYWLIGGVMDFMRTRYPKPRVLAGTVFYFFLVSVLAGSIVARLMFLFPGGAGLFHPTHGSNLAESIGVCMGRLASDKADSEEVKMRYCECWGEVIMTAFEHGDRRPPLEISQSADATCRPK